MALDRKDKRVLKFITKTCPTYPFIPRMPRISHREYLREIQSRVIEVLYYEWTEDKGIRVIRFPCDTEHLIFSEIGPYH